MNHHSLVQHYKILKHMANLSEVMFNNGKNPDIAKRMKWDIYETDDDTYRVLFDKTTSLFELIRIHKSSGYKLANTSITNTVLSYVNNYIYSGASNGSSFGLRLNCREKDIIYVTPDNRSKIDLSILPDTVLELLERDCYEELEFQYSTLYNFEGQSFQLYCIYSLLSHADNIHTFPVPGYYVNIDLVKRVYESDIDEVESALYNLLQKTIKDLSC